MDFRPTYNSSCEQKRLETKGVIDVALLNVIRRWDFREGMLIREIARRTGFSRNTVRKYLASGMVEPRWFGQNLMLEALYRDVCFQRITG